MILQKKVKSKNGFSVFFCCFLTVLVISFFSKAAECQNNNSQNRIFKLQEELKELRTTREKLRKDEISDIDGIAQIDKESNLVRSLTRQMVLQISKLKKSIYQINVDRGLLLKDFETQKTIYNTRLVHFYKQRNLGDLEILLSSKTLNKAIIWLKYKKRITQADQRKLEKLIATQKELDESYKQERIFLSERETLLNKKSQEEKNLKTSRSKKEAIIAKNRKDRKFIDQQINEKLAALKELELLIRADITRTESSPDRVKPTQFPGLKGKMMWPVNGKIIKKFGIIRNQYNLDERSYGIDIKAKMGDAVIATCDGVVSIITWRRGLGNILGIYHYGGYRTVFAHLSEIMVSEGDEVYPGKVIGRVGDLGSISGPILHFQVWQKTNGLDPEKWLTKKPG